MHGSGRLQTPICTFSSPCYNTRMKIVLINETNVQIQKGVLSAIQKVFIHRKNFAKKFKQFPSLNLIILPGDEICRLNAHIFKRRNETDVISVNLNTDLMLGEVYICPKVIEKNAEKYKVLFEEELIRVIIHGILHLLGYDHTKGFSKANEKMFEIQEKLAEQVMKELHKS